MYAKKQMVQYNLFLADGYSVSEYRCSCYGAGNQPYRYRGRSRKSINAHIESADTADTGNISLLGGLIQADNLLSALSAVYPTEKHTAIYGPMRNLDMNTWNTWVTYIGQYGAYGIELSQQGKVTSQEELNEKSEKYIYGCQVVADRHMNNC